MYLIINKTLNQTTQIEGSYPIMMIDALLDNNNDIIIVSLYSNTIKIPNGYKDHYGSKEYLWKEFPIPTELLKTI